MKQSALRIACAGLLMALAVAVSAVSIGAAVSDKQRTTPMWVRMAVRTEKGSEQVQLFAADGTLLQSLKTDATGAAFTELLEAGEYYAVTADSCTRFCLRENAASEVLGGCGWSDGEQLYLTGAQIGTVRIEGAAQGDWLDFVLTDGAHRRREVVYCKTETISCVFEGVPYGTYTLSEGGKQLCIVTVDAQSPDVTVDYP